MTPDSSPAPERPLLPQPHDGWIGLLALLCIAIASSYWAGPGAVPRLLCAWVLARFVSWLWHRDVGFGKVICVVAVPPVLLVYCLPKRLRRAVQACRQRPAPDSQGDIHAIERRDPAAQGQLPRCRACATGG